MKPKHLLLTSLFLLIYLAGSAQNISVKSFKVLPNDQTARVHEPVKDQNGEKCALIKVVTTQTGFAWEGGTLGITEVRKKTGEYWIYVPYGSKKITIKHNQLGVLRDYVYPEAIKKATVYEMVLTTANVKTVVEERKIPSQWLIIKSEPEGASVFIDGKLAGNTPFQRKYKEGEYNYRLEKAKYHNKAGKVNLKGEKKRLNITLNPRFGNIKVTSAPENGMTIYLDDENTGKKTPATLSEIASGEHTVKLQSQWYQPKNKRVQVNDAQTTDLQFSLDPVYANISVKTKPPSDIIIDGQKKANETWSGRLLEGIYTIKAEKEKYYSQEKQLEVVAGKDETVNFNLEGKTGSADIVTSPMDAVVYVDGKKQGTTPLTLNDYLMGEYELEIEKEGYGRIKKSFVIKEDETIAINEKLPDGKEVTLTSKPEGAKVYVENELQGTTPKTMTLGFGEHRVKMVNGERVVEKKINISQGGKGKWNFKVHESRGTFTDNRDGKVYKWVRIGDQIWMAENLAYDAGWGCWAYVKEEKNVKKYGYLYNLKNAKKACPDGWHLPSKEEFETLLNKFGGEGKKAYIALRSDVSSGFSALFGGVRDSDGRFGYLGYYGGFWSSSEDNSKGAWLLYFSSRRERASLSYRSKSIGRSVRCLQD
jgi:uncharacterized protein (TIGR02145 family)